MSITDTIKKNYREIQLSPLRFVEMMWNLTPQQNNDIFVKGKNITWQQEKFLRGVEEALRGEKSKRISVASGHGTGKDTVLSWLILWYLFCYQDAQIPCTAPTEIQMYDVLWKEISKWIDLMPTPVAEKYDWSTNYLRIKEKPETWFARARTARKETPEALAGIHGSFVMYIIDEASAVPDEIFNTAEGALTGDNFLFVMVSNPTRTSGYFYDSHHKDKEHWQCMEFSSEVSPLVSKEYVERIIQRFGKESDEYRIRVLGQFPRTEMMDDKGYMPLFSGIVFNITYDEIFSPGEKKMGIDPSGEGSDETKWVIRDFFKCRIVATEKKSTTKSIAQKTVMLAKHYDIDSRNIWIDNFGVGANISQELAMAGMYVNAVNVGESCENPNNRELYLNKRAYAYWELAKWMKGGGELYAAADWNDELPNIKYTRQGAGRIQIMSKKEMRREGFRSPNSADALMLTFLDGATFTPRYQEQPEEQLEVFDRYAAI